MLSVKRIVNVTINETPPLTQVPGCKPSVLLDFSTTDLTQVKVAKYDDYKTLSNDFKQGTVINSMGEAYFGSFSSVPNSVYVVQYSSKQTIDDVQKALLSLGNAWYVLVSSSNITSKDALVLASFIETGLYIFFTSVDPTTLKDKITNPFASFTRTALWATSDNCLTSAIASLLSSVDLSEASSSQTYAFKNPSIVKPTDISETQADSFDSDFINYFTDIGGTDMTYRGVMSDGGFIDVTQQKDFMQLTLQNALKNMFMTYKKVPYDNSGLSIIEHVITTECEDFNQSGIISQETIEGIQYKHGYKITLPDLTKVPLEDKQNRILKNILIAFAMSGAVESISINAQLK